MKRDWDFGALNREHGWAWPGEHTIAESMIHSRFHAPLARTAPTRDVRPEHDLAQLQRGLPVLPLSAYDVWERDTNPRHLLKRFREAVTEDPEAQPWLAARPYPEELCIAWEQLADLVVQEDRFLRRGDSAATIVFATRAGVAVASTTDGSAGRGLASYNTVAVEWRSLNIVMAVWVIKREHGRPGWTMIPELWREFIVKHVADRASMIAPLAESLAMAIKRTAARGVIVRPEVLESAANWRQFSEELMAKAQKGESLDKEAAPVFRGVLGGTADLEEGNKKLLRLLNKSRRRTPARARGQTFETTDVNAEVLTQLGETVRQLAERVDELARVVQELRDELGAEEPGETIPPKEG